MCNFYETEELSHMTEKEIKIDKTLLQENSVNVKYSDILLYFKLFVSANTPFSPYHLT